MDVAFLSPDEVPAFLDCDDIAFHETSSDAARKQAAELLELDRAVVARDGGQVVGTLAAFTFDLSVPGGDLPTAGVSYAAVLPTHRRRGALSRMMDAICAQARERGEPLAALFASEGTIYGRFGFGVAVRHATLAARPRLTPVHVDGGEDVPVRLVAREGAEALLAPVYARARVQRPGMASRTDAWWRLETLSDLEEHREDFTALRVAIAGDRERPDGYAIYAAKERWSDQGPDAIVRVQELVAATPAAEAALWRFLGGIDLVGELEVPNRPVDDLAPLLTRDPRAIRVTEVADALWVRILDLPGAVAARTWAAPARVVLDVAGARADGIGGRWALDLGPDGGSCTPTDRPPDLAVAEGDLAGLYLGDGTLARLVAAGRAQERTPGAAAALDAALRTPLAPWAATDF